MLFPSVHPSWGQQVYLALAEGWSCLSWLIWGLLAALESFLLLLGDLLCTGDYEHREMSQNVTYLPWPAALPEALSRLHLHWRFPSSQERRAKVTTAFEMPDNLLTWYLAGGFFPSSCLPQNAVSFLFLPGLFQVIPSLMLPFDIPIYLAASHQFAKLHFSLSLPSFLFISVLFLPENTCSKNAPDFHPPIQRLWKI